MDDPTVVALVTKTFLAALLIVGGIVALFIGKNLYVRGVGLHHDGTEVEIDNIKASLKTVGSVVMATSVAWGGLGYLTSPSYSLGPEGEKVASLSLPEGTVEAKGFAYTITGKINKAALEDPKELRELFTAAYKEAAKNQSIVTVNNHPTELNLETLSTFKSDHGQVFLVNYLDAGKSKVALTYDAKLKNGKIEFMPSTIGVLEGASVSKDDLNIFPDKVLHKDLQ